MRAGGVTRYASVEQIRIITKASPRSSTCRPSSTAGRRACCPNSPKGATIFVPKQLEEIRSGKNTVYVMGEVAKPGAFDSKPVRASSISSPIPAAHALCGYATDPAHQGRWQCGDGGSSALHRRQGRQASGGLSGDAIFVPEKTDTKEPSWLKIAPDRAVKLMGAVTRPGRYEWSDEMSLLDLLAQAGGRPTNRIWRASRSAPRRPTRASPCSSISRPISTGR